MDNRCLEEDDLQSQIARRKTASSDATPVVVSLSGALADMSGAIVRHTVQASPSGVPAAEAAVERPDDATLSGRLKEILGIVTSLPDSLDVSRGSYCGDGLREILQESGILDLSLSDRPVKPASNFAPPPPTPAPRHSATPCRRAVSSTTPTPAALRSQRLTGLAPRPPLRSS